MAQKRSFGLPLAILVLASLGAAVAQASVSRLAGDWRSSGAVTIPDSGPPATAVGTDLGAAPAGERLERMLLLLAPSAAQQQALATELGNLENPASPSYHQWLTPASFAASYANSASDVSAVAEWLQSEGFTVAPLPAGRGWIEFSGTVAQVEQTFQAQIHSVTTGGVSRPVLVGSISVPSAMSPLVQGLVSLDGALAIPALTAPKPVSISAGELAALTSPGTAEALTPFLAAQLLHLDVLRSAGIIGAGETIAIAARSNVTSADVDAFRAVFGLPAMPLKVVANGPDPGLAGDQAEATLEASWAGAAAPGAQVLLVPSATTSATDGVDLSLAAIIDQALAHTVAVGYSSCEAGMSPAHQAFYSALYRQAAAEGIAVIAATGDSGSSACYLAGSATPVSSGYGVNALASTPWNTAVGVAAFGPAGAAAGTTALVAWSPTDPADPAFASGGGSSKLYAAPSWQPIPAQLEGGIAGTGALTRLLPDVALPTAIDTSVNPGLAFCLSGAAPSVSTSGNCTLERSGGSSAAAAIFAGVAALVAAADGPQGNLAPSLYALSSRSGIFSDVRQGSSQLRCILASPECGATGHIGFSAGAGYDLTTGLGVPDVHALFGGIARPQATGTGGVLVSITTAPTTINPSALITINAQVAPQIGGVTPTGSILFFDASNGTDLSSTPSTVASNGTAYLSIEGGFALGANEIEAVYSGDTTYEAATSQPVDINVQPNETSLAVVPSSFNPNAGANFSVTATLTVAGTGGNSPPTGLVTLNLDGQFVASTNVNVTTAIFSVLAPTAGSHTLQAIYAGDSNYNGSTSPAITITVAKTATTLIVTPITTTPAAGSSLQVTATITPAATGQASPTGTVAFTLDGTSVGVESVTSGSPSTATDTLTVPSAGTHNLQASYSGDSNYGSSTSPIVPITVSKSATVTTLVSTPATLVFGSTQSFTATIVPANPASGVTTTVTGTVSFYDGTTLLGQAIVASNAATLSGISLKDSLNHSITAVYAGDGTWLGSTSSVVILLAITQPVTVVLTSNFSTVPPGAALILTATVIPVTVPPTTGEANPTGSVVFYNGTTVIGITALSPVPLNDSSVATFTTQTLPGGIDTVSAFYEGDLYFSPNTSNLLTLTVQNFTITPAPTNPPTNLNINKGGAGSVAYVITGYGGFNGEIQLVCTVPTQDDMTCTASPQQVVPTATVTFVVQTYASGTLARSDGPSPIWPRAAGGTALAVLGFFLLPFGRRARKLLLKSAGSSTQRLMILLLLLVGLVGTGIGCTSNTALSPYGTPLGVATQKITGSTYVDNTVVSQSIYLTVDVLAPGVVAP